MFMSPTRSRRFNTQYYTGKKRDGFDGWVFALGESEKLRNSQTWKEKKLYYKKIEKRLK